MAAHLGRLTLGVVASGALLAGCEHAQALPPPSGIVQIAAGYPALTVSAGRAIKGESYTFLSFGSTVEAYPSNNRKNKGPVCQVSGVRDARGIAIDRHGTLYVAEDLVRSFGVVTFARDCGAQGPNFDEYVGDPADPAVDGSTLYLSTINNVALPGLVEVYNIHGSGEPVATLTDPTAGEGIGVATDSHHDLFWSTTNVWSGGGQVIEFRRGKLPGMVLRGTIGSDAIGGVLVDAKDNLLVVDQTTQALNIYGPPYTAGPIDTIPLKGSALYCAFATNQSMIYCIDYTNVDVDAYAYPAGTYLYSYNNGIESRDFPIGIAVQPR